VQVKADPLVVSRKYRFFSVQKCRQQAYASAQICNGRCSAPEHAMLHSTVRRPNASTPAATIRQNAPTSSKDKSRAKQRKPAVKPAREAR